MIRRLLALLLALAVIPAAGAAELNWKEDTPAQQELKTYITNVNRFLTGMGEAEINSLFELYRDHAELGITSSDNAEIPENITVTVYLYYDTPDRLILRTCEVSRFQRIAAAFLQALNPETMSPEEALAVPGERAKKALRAPQDSFEEEVEELNGETPRAYYAYYPNQYHDGNNWIQMTVIFPLAGYWDGERGVISGETETRTPFHDEDQDSDYEGYFSTDEYEHLEVFSTATPEPDSAAAEYDEWNRD